MEIVRPLDVLNKAKGKEITVLLKNNIIYIGELKAFDIHLNLALSDAKELVDGKEEIVGDVIIRGDAIITIKNI